MPKQFTDFVSQFYTVYSSILDPVHWIDLQVARTKLVIYHLLILRFLNYQSLVTNHYLSWPSFLTIDRLDVCLKFSSVVITIELSLSLSQKINNQILIWQNRTVTIFSPFHFEWHCSIYATFMDQPSKGLKWMINCS